MWKIRTWNKMQDWQSEINIIFLDSYKFCLKSSQSFNQNIFIDIREGKSNIFKGEISKKQEKAYNENWNLKQDE